MIGKRHFSRFMWMRWEKRTGIVSFLSTRHPQPLFPRGNWVAIVFIRRISTHFASTCVSFCFFFLSLNFTPSDWGILLSFWQVGLWTLLSWLGLFQDLKNGGFMWQMRRGDLGEVIGTDTKWCSHNSILSFCFSETEASISYGYKQKNQQIIHRAFFFFLQIYQTKIYYLSPLFPALSDCINVFCMITLMFSIWNSSSHL